MKNNSQNEGSGRKFVLLGLILGLPMVIGLGLFGLYSSLSNEDLVLACVGEGSRLPPGLACHYLKEVRDPDPNRSVAIIRPQTLFGFTLAGHELSNPRSQDLIEYFLSKKIQWNAQHDAGLPPLHVVILFQQPDLVKRFLAAGASAETRINAPMQAFHGLNAIEFAGFLKNKLSEKDKQDEVGKLTRIEQLLAKVE